MNNFRIVMLSPDDLIAGDRVMLMAVSAGPGKPFLTKPCKLQMQIEVATAIRGATLQWVDVPFENMPAHPYVKASEL